MQFTKGRYRVSIAAPGSDISEALALRRVAFRSGSGEDADRFDPLCRHVQVHTTTGLLVCTARLLCLRGGHDIERSYAAQFYDLEALRGFNGPLIEMGRFCVRPGQRDPDIVRAAWAAVTRVVEQSGARLLFGCTSFTGVDATEHAAAFAWLGAHHLAPGQWAPRVKAPAVVRFGAGAASGSEDPRAALRGVPPLLRSYLAMGGWVSDHAVIDRDLGTLHVFTALDIGAIPAARARRLRAVAV